MQSKRRDQYQGDNFETNDNTKLFINFFHIAKYMKNRDYFMGRARVRNFRTSWYVMYQKSNERAQRASEISDTNN